MNTEQLATFCKQKGFVYQSSEIYGGLAGVYDYGHTGTLLKHNWIQAWKKFFIRLDPNFFEIDTGIAMHESVFKASGHLKNFFDPIVSIEGSTETHRADHVIEEATGEKAEGFSTEKMLSIITEQKLLGDIDYAKVSIENLNMMFPIDMGPKKGTKAYLRPETAQSPYVNFKLQFELLREKLPMGLALIGRVYRNEIAPRNMLLRTREVEQAELQIFFNPNKIDEHPKFEEYKDFKVKVQFAKNRNKDPEYIALKDLPLPKFYAYHMAKVQEFYFNVMKVPEANFKFLELDGKEKAFYNKFHFDIEVNLNSAGWTEVGGIHYRTDHDLKGHQEVSKKKMEVFDATTGERFIPHVLELSFGLGRNIYTLLDQHYNEDEARGNVNLQLPNKLAPYQVAIFPLMGKPVLTAVAEKLFNDLIDEDIVAVYDKSGSVGKRYARQDEIGTPYCVTIDYETIEDGANKGTVTIRNRDTTEQERIKLEDVKAYVS
jgi:glycyl-tRNA synthetase